MLHPQLVPALTAMLAVLLSRPAAAQAPGPQPHSHVDASTSRDGDNLRFDFKVSFPAGLHLNLEAPWTLALQSAPGLKFNKNRWSKGELDQALPGFRVKTTAKPSQAAGTLDFTLTAFVCTDDQGLCYRDVLPGKVSWQAP